MTAAAADTLHAAVAEHGKICALDGDHVTALLHYREAMAMGVRQNAPAIVMRHYLECALESLEHMGAYDELLQYCDRAVEHYRLHPPEQGLAQFDLATIHQRRGVALLKQGKRDEASRAFRVACATAAATEAHLPLAEALLRWIEAQLTITPERLAAEQQRHRYYSVRTDTVIRSRAVPLPGHSPLGTSPIPSQGGA